MSSPHRRSPDQPPSLLSPVKCKDCQHWRTGPPLDCVLVPQDTRRRALEVVSRRWTAEGEGCADFTPRSAEGWFSRLLRWAGVRGRR